MVTKKSWKEFRESGLLWWINTILQTFGWAIIVDVKDDGSISDAYPARVKFRGFIEEHNTIGYQQVSKFLLESMPEIAKEANE